MEAEFQEAKKLATIQVGWMGWGLRSSLLEAAVVGSHSSGGIAKRPCQPLIFYVGPCRSACHD